MQSPYGLKFPLYLAEEKKKKERKERGKSTSEEKMLKLN